MSSSKEAHAPMRRTKSSLLAIKLREVRIHSSASQHTRYPMRPTCARARCSAVISRSLLVYCSFNVHSAQFLDSTDENVCDMPLPHVPAASHARPPLAPLQHHAQPAQPAKAAPANPGTVWVDCFFYGFYMEKSKLPMYQSSLRKKRQAEATPGPQGGAIAV